MTAREKFQQKETLKVLTLVMYQVKPPVGRIFLSDRAFNVVVQVAWEHFSTSL